MTYMAQKQPRLALHRLSTSWLSGSLVGYSFRRAALARTGEDARAYILATDAFSPMWLPLQITPETGGSRAGSGIAGFSRPESGLRYRLRS